MKYIILFGILLIRSMFNYVDAQEYKIESLDGGIQTIHVLPYYAANTLNILCLNDTLHIGNFTGIEDSIIVLNKKFLKIVYIVRGGSGIHLSHALLLCVQNKRLCQSINLTSTFDEEFIDFSKKHDPLNMVDEKSIYELNLNLEGSNIQTYKLTVGIHDQKKSKDDTSANHNHNYHVILNFDKSQNIFYSNIENISEYFTLYDPKTQIENKQFISGELPVIKLGYFKYYYIKGIWYEEGDNNYLTKYSYR